MKEYLLLLRAGKPMASKTDEENKAELQAWGVYVEGLAKNGSYVGGSPVVGGGKTVSASGTVDQAVTSANEGIVGGYLIVKAENFIQATEIAKACPHIENEGNIEVREIAPMPAI